MGEWAEKQRKANDEARRAAEERAKKEFQEKANRKAKEKARKDAEVKAKKECDDQASTRTSSPCPTGHGDSTMHELPWLLQKKIAAYKKICLAGKFQCLQISVEPVSNDR